MAVQYSVTAMSTFAQLRNIFALGLTVQLFVLAELSTEAWRKTVGYHSTWVAQLC